MSDIRFANQKWCIILCVDLGSLWWWQAHKSPCLAMNCRPPMGDVITIDFCWKLNDSHMYIVTLYPYILLSIMSWRASRNRANPKKVCFCLVVGAGLVRQ